MSDFVSGHRDLVYGETLHDKLHGLLNQTPWWAISLVMHLGFMVFAYHYQWKTPRPKPTPKMTAQIVRDVEWKPVRMNISKPKQEQQERTDDVRTETPQTTIDQTELPKIDLDQVGDPDVRSILSVPDGARPAGGTRTKGFVPIRGGLKPGLEDDGLYDILTRERSLAVWLFDESRSMKDDQQVVRQKVDELYRNLGVALADSGRSRRLLTAVCSYGENFHVLIGRPTDEMARIKKAIDNIPIDKSGKENYLTAINGVLKRFAGYCKKYNRHLVIIMVTDEGGDDDNMLEDGKTPRLDVTLAGMKRAKAILIVFGSEAGGFAYPLERTYDPTVPKQYSPWGYVNRGIDTAFDQMFPHDWRFRTTRRVPSGFGPYGPSRLCRETGGIYYLLRDASAKAYDYEKLLSGYQPELASRLTIAKRNSKNPVRRVIIQVVQGWKSIRDREEWRFRYTFSNGPPLRGQIAQATRAVDDWIKLLTDGIRRLKETGNVTFEHSPKHWQAYRDLMLAQMHKLRFQLVQYKLAMHDLSRGRNIPPAGDIGWYIAPYGRRVLRGDPKEVAAEKKKIEALYAEVMQKHANTPWEIYARSEMRGLIGWAIRPYSRSGGGGSRPPIPQ